MLSKYHRYDRLQDRDYAQDAYFVTFSTAEHRKGLGEGIGVGSDASMQLNAEELVVEECWNAIPLHFPNVTIDQTQIMLNHLHGIVVLERPRRQKVPVQQYPIQYSGVSTPVGRQV